MLHDSILYFWQIDSAAGLLGNEPLKVVGRRLMWSRAGCWRFLEVEIGRRRERRNGSDSTMTNNQ